MIKWQLTRVLTTRSFLVYEHRKKRIVWAYTFPVFLLLLNPFFYIDQIQERYYFTEPWTCHIFTLQSHTHIHTHTQTFFWFTTVGLVTLVYKYIYRVILEWWKVIILKCCFENVMFYALILIRSMKKLTTMAWRDMI